LLQGAFHRASSVARTSFELGPSPWKAGPRHGPLLAHGYNFDAGIAQVNSANFERLGLTVETALEPCANLRAAERLLKECQTGALERYGAGERAEAGRTR